MRGPGQKTVEKDLPVRNEEQSKLESSLSSNDKPISENINQVIPEEIENRNKSEISENYSITAQNKLLSKQSLLSLATSSIDDEADCLSPSVDIGVENNVNGISMISSTKTTNNSFDIAKLATAGKVQEYNENDSEFHHVLTVNYSSPSTEEEKGQTCLVTESSIGEPCAASEEMEGKDMENKLREGNLVEQDCLSTNIKTVMVKEADNICTTEVGPLLNESVSKPEEISEAKIIKAAAADICTEKLQGSLCQNDDHQTDKKNCFVTHKSKTFNGEPSFSKIIEPSVEKGDHSQLVNDGRIEEIIQSDLSNLESFCSKNKSEDKTKIQGNLQEEFLKEISDDQIDLISNDGTHSWGEKVIPLLINTNEIKGTSPNEHIPDVGIETGPPQLMPFRKIAPKLPVSSVSSPQFSTNQVLKIKRITPSSTKTKVPVDLKKILLKKSGTFNVSNQKVHLTGKSLIIPSSLVRSQPSNSDLLSKEGPNNVQSSSSGVKYIWVCKNKLSNLITSLKEQLSDSISSENSVEPEQHKVKGKVTGDGSVIELSDDSQEASSQQGLLTFKNDNSCLQVNSKRENCNMEMVNEQEEISSLTKPSASSSRLKVKSLSELLTNPKLVENSSKVPEKGSTYRKKLKTDEGSGKDTSFHPIGEENTGNIGNIGEKVGADELNRSFYNTPSDPCRMSEDADSSKEWNEISTSEKSTINKRRRKRKKSVWIRNIIPKRKVYRWIPSDSKDSSDTSQLNSSVDSDLVENKINCSEIGSSDTSFNSASTPLKKMSVNDIYSTILNKSFEGDLIVNISENTPPKLDQSSLISNVNSVYLDQFRIASSAQEVIQNLKRTETENNLLKQFNILNELIIQIGDNLDTSGYEYDKNKGCFVLKSVQIKRSGRKKSLEKFTISPGKRKRRKTEMSESTVTESESEDNFRPFSASTPPPLRRFYEEHDVSKHVSIDNQSPSQSFCDFAQSHSNSGSLEHHLAVQDETRSFSIEKSKTAMKNCVQMEHSELSDSHQQFPPVQNSVVISSTKQNDPLNSEKHSLEYCDNLLENLKVKMRTRNHEPLVIPSKTHNKESVKSCIASCDAKDASSMPKQSECELTSIRHQRSSNDQLSDTPPFLEKTMSDSSVHYLPITSIAHNVRSKEEGMVYVETPKPIVPSIIVKGNSKSEAIEMPCITNVISLTRLKNNSVRVKPSMMSSPKLRGLSRSNRTMFSTESNSLKNSSQLLLRDPPGEFHSLKESKHSVNPSAKNHFKIFRRPRGRPRKMKSLKDLNVKKRTSSSPILNKEMLSKTEERSVLEALKKELSELAWEIFEA